MIFGTGIRTLSLMLCRRISKVSLIGLLAPIGVLVVVGLVAARVVRGTDLQHGFNALWRPSLAIMSIMLSTSLAQRLGILAAVAAKLIPRRGRSPFHLFRSVFTLSAITAAILNNDAAILVLTPLIIGPIGVVRRCYPGRDDLLIPFAFAVFSAAGVAPFATSNPMNLILADYTGLAFNEYALRMAPIAVAGWLVAYAILRLLFRGLLQQVKMRGEVKEDHQLFLSYPAWLFLVIMAFSLGCYPVFSFLGAPVWVVAAATAVFGVALCWRYGIASPAELSSMVPWQIIVFLFCVFVTVLGLHNLGLVNLITALYSTPSGASTQIALIGVSSAVGSALLNNHPMAILNALVISSLANGTHQQVAAALIGGDLGPRLLPWGSLAGLLWMEMLRQQGVNVSWGQFIRVGAAVTVPTLAISLAILLLFEM